jgi:hypothetical protein
MSARIGSSSGFGELRRWQRRAKPRSPIAKTVAILTLTCLAGALCLVAKEKPPTTYKIPLPPKPDFSEVNWLVGEWIGSTTDRTAPGEIRLSVSYELDNRVMLLHEEASFQATKTSPAMKESWMGVLTSGREAVGFLLCTFSSTGFISRYRVTVDGPETHINPEGGEQPPPGWLFRTVIKRTAPKEFVETVEAAPPNKSFFDYYTARLTRVTVEEKAKTKTSPPTPP